MHQYIHGHWSASSYDHHGNRTDHQLQLSLDGTFRWLQRSDHAGEQCDNGAWMHQEDDTITLSDDLFEQTSSWTVHYVTDLEDTNCLLVLRWLALASRNLPIMFYRIHPPDDPVWSAE